MDTIKVQELKAKFKIGQNLKLKITLDGKDENTIRKTRTCKVAAINENHLLVEFTNLGKYKECFKYTDFLTGDVVVLKWN